MARRALVASFGAEGLRQSLQYARGAPAVAEIPVHLQAPLQQPPCPSGVALAEREDAELVERPAHTLPVADLAGEGEVFVQYRPHTAKRAYVLCGGTQADQSPPSSLSEAYWRTVWSSR
jgi:hypothetical protein